MTVRAPAAGKASGRRDAIEAIWSTFVSLRLTLYLLVALAAASGLGTFVAPAEGPSVLRAQVGNGALLAVVQLFELGDLFHSWWFTVLLWGLAFNLIACTLERLPKVWRLALKSEHRLTEAVLRERRHVYRHPVTGDPKEVRERVAAAMRKHGFDPSLEEDSGTAYLFAERGRLSRFGAHVTHLALLIILLGGIIGRLGGAQGLAQPTELGGSFDAIPVRATDGSTYPRPLGFAVQATDFRLLTFGDGAPRQYETDLQIFDGPEGAPPVQRQTISVNHPMQYGGWTFYQASYEEVPDVRSVRIEVLDKATGTRNRYKLLVEEAVELADGTRLGLVDSVADHAGAGPALHLARAQDGVLTDFWVFQAFPDFDAANRDDRWGVDFVGTEPVYLTGIQVVRDPGADIVFAGCILLAFGLAQSFYASHRRIWARIDEKELVLAGSSHRSPQQFAREFAEVNQSIVGS